MDKTIIIDGKPVVFRKTAGTAVRYQMQFGREFMEDFQQILELRAHLTEDTPKDEKIKAVMSMQTVWMYDLAFIMAQQADPTITDELEWLDRFDSIDIMSVMLELIPLIVAENKVSPKNA